MILPILFVWLLSIVGSFSLKYMFNTTYLFFYCLEGFSENYWMAIGFNVFLLLLSTVLPTIFNTLFYVFIIKKVRSLKTKLKKINNVQQSETTSKNTKKSFVKRLSSVLLNLKNEISVNSIHPAEKRKRKSTATSLRSLYETKARNSNLALQVIIINLVSFISSIFSVLVNSQVKFATVEDFNFLMNDFEYVRPVFRICFLIFQSSIPIASLYYSIRHQLWLTLIIFKIKLDILLSDWMM